MSKEKTTDFDEFTDKAQEFRDATDKPIEERDMAAEPVDTSHGLKGLKRMKDASDRQFFSLGPVYAHCRIDKDILAEFAAATGLKFDAFTQVFKVKLFRMEGSWAHILQAIPTEVFDEFDRFMSSQSARRVETGEYWRFVSVAVSLPDPYAIENRDLKIHEQNVQIPVFVPSGVRYCVQPRAQNLSLPVLLIETAPDPAIVRESTTGLGKDLSEEEYKRFFETKGELPFQIT